MTSEWLFNSFIPPKNLYPQNKFLATPLTNTGQKWRYFSTILVENRVIIILEVVNEFEYCVQILGYGYKSLLVVDHPLIQHV